MYRDKWNLEHPFKQLSSILLVLYFFKICLGPGVVVPVYNSRTWEQRQENHKFKAGLGYIVRLCFKNRIKKYVLELEFLHCRG
jgi:hypothetical protein